MKLVVSPAALTELHDAAAFYALKAGVALGLAFEAIQFHLEDMKAVRLQIPRPASKSTFVEVALAA